MSTRWVITCEHGGNEVPEVFRYLFAENKELLETHRGWDPGALSLFELLQPLADFSKSTTTSRLLVECNRSLHHPNLFSAYSKSLPEVRLQEIVAKYYLPYRHAVEAAIDAYLQQGDRVFHLSIHSFTPVLNGETRNADAGLLYDPRRPAEKELCQTWKKAITEALPQFRVRYNYPYKGTADGFTTYLRKKFPEKYAGVEFELNQQWANNEAIYQQLLQSVQQLQEIMK